MDLTDLSHALSYYKVVPNERKTTWKLCCSYDGKHVFNRTTSLDTLVKHLETHDLGVRK